MKDQVVELEVAKELKLPEGFESEFSWYCRAIGYWGWEVLTTTLAQNSRNRFEMEICEKRRQFVNKEITKIVNEKIGLVPTPTIHEMLRILPEKIEDKGIVYSLIIDVHSRKVVYETQESGGSLIDLEGAEFYFDKTNLATALARLYMWLVENGYINKS
jgi:hypothetical protein